MIKKLFYCLLFILIIIASLSLWPFIEIPYKETSIIGDYSANKYNPNNYHYIWKWQWYKGNDVPNLVKVIGV